MGFHKTGIKMSQMTGNLSGTFSNQKVFAHSIIMFHEETDSHDAWLRAHLGKEQPPNTTANPLKSEFDRTKAPEESDPPTQSKAGFPS